MESIEKFRELGLSQKILSVIQELKFEEPTEIQRKAIPLVLQGKDIIGKSATGSGKTLVFGSGIIENTRKGEGIQALVLTPTRELAEQVTQTLKNFSKNYNLRIVDVYGGVSINPQISALKNAEIVVGTPGRILDHLNKKTLDLRRIRFLVLDEADRMLDMGFIEDVQKIVEYCPRERQTLLFSATISSDIEHIARKYMENPEYVEVESYVDPSKLKQIYYNVPNNLKFSLLVYLLKDEKSGLIMVFCNTRRNADLIARNLKRYGLYGNAIHGGLSQNRRSSIMKDFHSGSAYILICTDVAARGLDIKGVSHVYNYDSPKTSTEYIHRIGRTARAGKDGKAITLVSPRDFANFRNVTERNHSKIMEEGLPKLQIVNVKFDFSPRNRFGREFKGRREFRGNGNLRRRESHGSGDFGKRREFRGSRNFGKNRNFRRRF